MKRIQIPNRLAAAALALALAPGFAACGAQSAPQPTPTESPAPTASATPELAPAAESSRSELASERMKGIFDALIAPDSDYSRTKNAYKEFYPELKYTETLEQDRIALGLDPNGNEYITGGAWEFVEEGDSLTSVMAEDDFTGMVLVLNVANAVGTYYGMDTTLINGYVNGLGALEIQSDNFSMTKDATGKTTVYKINISGPWDMKELDQMVLDEKLMGGDPLGSSGVSQSGNVGKIRMMANGSADHYTMLFAEYGGLDDAAYQSIVNMVTLRKPTGWEKFLADFTELKALETDDYKVVIDPKDDIIADIMDEPDGKFTYVLVEFGSEPADGVTN